MSTQTQVSRYWRFLGQIEYRMMRMKLNGEPLLSLTTRDSTYEPARVRDAIPSASRQNGRPWADSSAKRWFDLALVLAISPALLPLSFAVTIAIRWASPGPVLFRQKRVGRNGTRFTMFKFRTMIRSRRNRLAISTVDDPAISSIGRLLRRWKLDELPQFLNVVRGEMSLVGPRPKVPQQQAGSPMWRPGITGAATIAFANEETLLAGIPEAQLEK